MPHGHGRKAAVIVRDAFQIESIVPFIGMDRVFALWLTNNEGAIGPPTVISEKSRIQVVSGPLKEMEGRIAVMGARTQIEKVSFTLGGSPKQFWLSFEFLKKD